MVALIYAGLHICCALFALGMVVDYLEHRDDER